MIVKTQRRFLPEKIKVSSWEIIEPYFNQLLVRKIDSAGELESWLKDKSELDAFLSEDLAWRYVHMTCDTENKELEQAYLFFCNRNRT
jgi:oligoendopeptidase F